MTIIQEEVALEVPGNFVFSYTHSSGETCTNVIAVSDCVFLSTCRDENIDSCPFSANARMNGTLTLMIVAENAFGQSQPTIPTTFSKYSISFPLQCLVFYLVSMNCFSWWDVCLVGCMFSDIVLVLN